MTEYISKEKLSGNNAIQSRRAVFVIARVPALPASRMATTFSIHSFGNRSKFLTRFPFKGTVPP